MILMNFLVKKVTGFQRFITSIGMGKLYLIVMSTYVIIYETPTSGAHHFSLSFWSSFEQEKMPLNNPKWVHDLQKKSQFLDLDTTLLAINCAAAAKLFFERQVGCKDSFDHFPIFCMFGAFTWHLFALTICLFSTLFYVILQFFHSFLSYGSQPWIYNILAKVFSNTCKIVRIRCCQILYWPIFLQDHCFRSRSCVEFAEKAMLRRHSMWSSVAVDVLLGNVFGLALLYHAESASLWVLNVANDFTNNFLRSGCVWLMGVPAGFKLNTELAGILGMFSLNVIQMWSTLWFFVGFLFIYVVKIFAISGILFGVTIPAALTIDMIALTTLHVSTLHWLISLSYSHQIQALAALWRLFRGRKWNPLRQRFDSYDYAVEQHIVGSLLFTPVLLLLPTTSLFYIFFTIMDTSIGLICVLIEISISIIHVTPYLKIFLWLVRPRRFPSGIWFEIISCRHHILKLGKSGETGPPFTNLQRRVVATGTGLGVMVSMLHSNFLSMRQIVVPHYRNVFSGVSGSFIGSLAYGVLTGKRIPFTLGTVFPSRLPWILIPYKNFYRLCRESILACSGDHNAYVFQ